VNNLWSTIYATVLNDAENIIVGANANNSPHYSGVTNFKSYTYQLAVDTWGTISFSDTQKLAGNVKPKYDLDENNLYWINTVRSR
jgi:hypothetical protein